MKAIGRQFACTMRLDQHQHFLLMTMATRADYDVAALVINNGSGVCKAGFADDDALRVVFPSFVSRYNVMHLTESSNFYIGDQATERRDILTMQPGEGKGRSV